MKIAQIVKVAYQESKKALNKNEVPVGAVIFDDKNTAEDFADSVGTISYEILTNLSSRIERRIIS